MTLVVTTLGWHWWWQRLGDDVGIVLGVITTKPRIEDVNRNLWMRVKKERKIGIEGNKRDFHAECISLAASHEYQITRRKENKIMPQFRRFCYFPRVFPFLLSVSLCIPLCPFSWTYLSICLSICLSVYRSAWLAVCPQSVSLTIYIMYSRINKNA